MKHWIAAVATAPLLMACASAGAADSRAYAETDASGTVLVLNGERILIRDGAHAVHIIEHHLNQNDDVDFDFDFDFESSEWSEAEERAFEEEIERLAETLSDMASLHIRVDGAHFDEDELERRIEIIVDQAERQAERAERHAERIERHYERHAERLERQAERVARQAERQARRAERMAIEVSLDGNAIATAGVQAAEAGLAAGVRAIDHVLERGYREDDGVRIPLTEQEIEELQETRNELEDSLDELRDRNPDEPFEPVTVTRESHHSYESTYHSNDNGREVRVIERNGETRVWINGRELTGAEKETWLEAWITSEQTTGLDGAPKAHGALKVQ